MATTTSRRVFFGLILALCLVAAPTSAVPNISRTTHFTFSHAVLLPGVSLPAGTYIFEMPEPNLARNLVRVMSKDRSKIYLTSFTHMVTRPMTNDLAAALMLGEHSPHNPPRVTVWYPADEVTGRQFIY